MESKYRLILALEYDVHTEKDDFSNKFMLHKLFMKVHLQYY